MNLGDIKVLRTPALLLLLTVAVGAGAIYYTDILLKHAKRQLAQQELQLKEARNRLYQSGEEREVITRYLERYQQLQRLGFIGDEQRINWLDGLRIANQQADLFGVDYQISEQRPYAYAQEYNPGQLQLHQSAMKLRFGLLHEADLTRFFSALGQAGAGLFYIDQCLIRRIDAGATLRYQPNLSAECELSWITARPSVPEKKP
jgi:primosomal replication protein N